MTMPEPAIGTTRVVAIKAGASFTVYIEEGNEDVRQ
jgi:hypothetical protein